MGADQDGIQAVMMHFYVGGFRRRKPAMQAQGKTVELVPQTAVSSADMKAELARLDTAPKRQPAMSRSKSIVF